VPRSCFRRSLTVCCRVIRSHVYISLYIMCRPSFIITCLFRISYLTQNFVASHSHLVFCAILWNCHSSVLPFSFLNLPAATPPVRQRTVSNHSKCHLSLVNFSSNITVFNVYSPPPANTKTRKAISFPDFLTDLDTNACTKC